MIKRISVDDGCRSDLKLARLCDKYHIPLVVYLPVEWQSYAYFKNFTPLTYDEAYWLAHDFELGGHSITHRLLTRISTSEAMREIVDSKRLLKRMFDTQVTKFAPPRGYTNDTLDIFIADNYQSCRLTVGDNLVHIHPRSGSNDNRHWLEAVNDDTEELWGHSWELDRYDQWHNLERYLDDISAQQ